MILVDTGPLVALFDPQDGQHDRCRRILKEIRDVILTTTPVLTEAFHMLGPARHRLRSLEGVRGARWVVRVVPGSTVVNSNL
jgi:predicted nucleic acid-binding protein